MATITSVRTGDWFNPSTWDSNSIPASIDDVILNHPVRVNSNIIVGSIRNLNTGGGELIISTNLTITCTGTGILGNKVLLISPKTINSPLIQNVGGVVLDSIPQPLLDLYPGAIGAWSLRLLRASHAGGLIRVRRSSDNNELDIGVDSNGNLDTVTLSTFCSGTNGFVTTWYDQSGNNKHGVQIAAISQPQIVNNGSVLTQNGRPTVSFDGSNDFLSCGFINGGTKPNSFSSMNVSRLSNIITTRNIFGSINVGGANSSGYASFGAFNDSKMFVWAGNSSNSNLYIIAKSVINNTTSQQLNAQYYTNGNNFINYYRNGLGQAMTYPFGQPTNINTGTEEITSIGGLGANPTLNLFIGDQQENIVYPSDQTANRVAIENNIKTYYGIP